MIDLWVGIRRLLVWYLGEYLGEWGKEGREGGVDVGLRIVWR